MTHYSRSIMWRRRQYQQVLRWLRSEELEPDDALSHATLVDDDRRFQEAMRAALEAGK